MMRHHLLFYDGECGLCDRAVQFILKRDKDKRFLFAPLQGKTAVKELESLSPQQKSADSMVLIENYQEENAKICIQGKAALKAAWYLGGFWMLFGLLSFLPALPFDLVYRCVAHNRHRLFVRGSACTVPKGDRDQFLP